MEGRQGVPLACLSWSGTTPFQLEEGSWAQCSQPAMCEVDKACVPWEGLGKRKETASKLHSPGTRAAGSRMRNPRVLPWEQKLCD